jgi:hypothetical protein
MTYRDTTFCNAVCTTYTCFRRLTKEVSQKANEAGLPVSIADFSNHCPEYTLTFTDELKMEKSYD